MAHQFPSYPSIDTGDSGLNFSDPVQEYQAVEENGTYRDYRLGVGGADLELSDTSSCYLANPVSSPSARVPLHRQRQIWSPTQSYTTAETRDHLDTVESHPQTGLPVPSPKQNAFAFDQQTNGLGGWQEKEQVSPGSFGEHSGLPVGLPAQMEVHRDPSVNHDAQTHHDSSDPVEEARYFCEKHFQDIRSGKIQDDDMKKRLVDSLDIMRNDVSGAAPYRCHYCTSSFSTKGACLRHVQDYHHPQLEYKCSYCKNPESGAKKNRSRDVFHRQDKFKAHLTIHFKKKPPKSELERHIRPLACMSSCPVCHYPVSSWTDFYNHFLDKHCRCSSAVVSPVDSRRSSVSSQGCSTNDDLPSPTANTPPVQKDQNGHLLPGFNIRPNRPRRGSHAPSAGSPPSTLSPSNPPGNRISPYQAPANSALPSFGDENPPGNPPGSPSAFFPPQGYPEIRRDSGYTSLLFCLICGHNRAQCNICHSFSAFNAGEWCHECSSGGGGAANTIYQPPPELQFSPPTPVPNPAFGAYQPPSATHGSFPTQLSFGAQRGRVQRQNSPYDSFTGTQFHTHAGGGSGGSQVLTVVDVPGPIEPIITECKPGIFQVGPLGIGSMARSISLPSVKAGMKGLGGCLLDIKDRFVGGPSPSSQAALPPATEPPLVVTECGNSGALRARVDIGKGEKVDMSVRVLCGKKPGKLLHSRVQIVVKLLKLRTSAAETAEKRHRKQSEASEEDVIAAVEVSESAQEQNEQEEKDKEQEQDENKENAESPQEQDNRDDDDEDDPVGNDQEGEESRSNEESALLNMESLTTSLANQLTLWSPTCLDAAWADFADSTDSDDEHEESILGIFMAADLQSCLQNMPNWYDLLKEIISSDNQSVELIFHRLVWMLYNSSEVDPKKQLK